MKKGTRTTRKQNKQPKRSLHNWNRRGEGECGPRNDLGRSVWPFDHESLERTGNTLGEENEQLRKSTFRTGGRDDRCVKRLGMRNLSDTRGFRKELEGERRETATSNKGSSRHRGKRRHITLIWSRSKRQAPGELGKT